MANISEVMLLDNYGPLKKGLICTLVEKGYDWYKVKNNGKCVTIPKSLATTSFARPVKEEDEEDFGFDEEFSY